MKQMKLFNTRLNDLQIFEIQRTGKSIYGFLQEAVQEKLDNINSVNAIEVINLKLDKQTEEFQSFKKETEHALLKTIEIVVKYTNRSETILADFKAMHEKNRDDTNEALKKMDERLVDFLSQI